MKKKFSKILSLLLAVSILIGVAPLSGFKLTAEAAETVAETGQCGENVFWNFNEDTGLLTISGTGRMSDFDHDTPFGSNRIIESVVIEDGITYIGAYTFYSCWSLKEISVPQTVTEIGYHAFEVCSQLDNVILPSEIEVLPPYVFSLCTGLKSIVLPDKLREIGSFAFSYCFELEEIQLPDGVVSIDDNAFRRCGFSSLTLNDGLKYVGDQAFSYCESLASLTLNDGLKYVGNNVFSDCSIISKISIPDSVEIMGLEKMYIYDSTYYKNAVNWYNGALYIGNHLICVNPQKVFSKNYSIRENTRTICGSAFDGCEKIESITIPESVTMIGKNAFCNCKNLKTVNNLSDNLIRVGSGAFDNTAFIQNTENYEDGCLYIDHCLLSGKDAAGEVDVKEGTSVIADYAFSKATSPYEGNSQITDVVLPDGFKSIGEGAFRNCSSLESAETPCSLQYVFNYAFLNAGSLKEIYLPKGLKEFDYLNNYTQNGLTLYYEGTEEEWNDLLTDKMRINVSEAKRYGQTNIEFESECNFEHDIGEWTTVKEPTCTEEGISQSHCSFCGETFEKKIDITEHSLTHKTVNATCTEDGSEYDECSVCKNVFNKTVLPATGHSYKDTVVPPTDTENGYTKHVCEGCGDTYNDNFIDPLGHSYKSEVTKEPTCTEKGIRTYTCETCNDSFTEDIPAAGHSYSPEITKAATCMETGIRTYICHCGDTYTETIPLEEHVLVHTVQAATCTQAGAELDRCSVCGKSFNAKVIPATGHSYKDGICTSCGKAEFWDYTVTGGTVTITNYTGSETELEIPSEIAGYTVTAIADSAFSNNKKLVFASVPDTVASIGGGAFRNCTALREVYFGEKLTRIGENAFAGCTSLALACSASDNLVLSGAFSNNDKRFTFISRDGSTTASNAATAGLNCITYTYPKEKDGKNALAFNGTTTLYQNLSYYFWIKLADRYPDTYYFYFDTLTFDGVRSDSVKIDGKKISDAEYLTLNEVYISIKDGKRNITFKEMMELIDSGRTDLFVSFRDDRGEEKTVWEEIGDFFTSVFNALSKAINAIVSIFKKKK